MQWIIQNWFWILIGVVFIGMHLFGHGGHGGHGGGCGSSGMRKGESGRERQRPTPGKSQSHETGQHNH